MGIEIVGAETFRGKAEHVADIAMDPQFSQTDQNGDRFLQGAWRPRRGLARTGYAKMSGAIKSAGYFEGPVGVMVLVVDATGDVQGLTAGTPGW